MGQRQRDIGAPAAGRRHVKFPPLVATLLRTGWSVANYRDRQVSRLEGPAFTVIAVAAAAAAGGPVTPPACAATGALLAGRIDDVWGSDSSRGLRGHLGRLRRGRLTTGTAKIVVLAATGTGTAIIACRASGSGGPPPGPASVHDAAVLAGCVALGANLANLFDLRPGRALKVVLAASLPGSLGGSRAAPLLTGVTTAALACLPADLAERTMLGDAGANPAGALTGLGLALSTGPRGRRMLLTGMLALTMASEVVSFSQVIRAVAPLRWLDELGRREPA
jgi:hypothetical protein